jgi:hypothetical protein
MAHGKAPFLGVDKKQLKAAKAARAGVLSKGHQLSFTPESASPVLILTSHAASPRQTAA